MRVDGLIFADDTLMETIRKLDNGPEQVANVATLPGIQKSEFGHARYPLGLRVRHRRRGGDRPPRRGASSRRGASATTSTAACASSARTSSGPRPNRSSARWSTSSSATSRPASASRGLFKFEKPKLARLDGRGGVVSLMDLGYGTAARPRPSPRPAVVLDGADPDRVSDRAYTRGYDQCGTLGVGQPLPRSPGGRPRPRRRLRPNVMGLREGQVTVLIHSGSRGLGYQVCDDHLAMFRGAPEALRLHGCPTRNSPAPRSEAPRGRRIIAAMRSAANYAWCNRQLARPPGARRSSRGCSAKSWESLWAWRWSTTSRTTSPSSRITKSPSATPGKSASTAKAPPGPSLPATPRFPSLTRASANPSSSPAAWARQAGSWPDSPAA